MEQVQIELATLCGLFSRGLGKKPVSYGFEAQHVGRDRAHSLVEDYEALECKVVALLAVD